MRALSLTQPWATLVAIGAKKVETRSWPAPRHVIGDRILIHAAKRFPLDCQELMRVEPFRSALAYHGITADNETQVTVPRGAIVASAVIAECMPTSVVALSRGLDPTELAFGDYSPGRYALFLRDVRPLREPILARGALGFWWVPTDVLMAFDEEDA